MQQIGTEVNVAAFGQVAYWTGSDALSIEEHPVAPEGGAYRPVEVIEQGGWHLGVSWEYPRQFHNVKVHFAPGSRIPELDSVKLQYWRHNWPPKYQQGWTAVDDPHNGSWVTVNGDAKAENDIYEFEFDPLDITEVAGAEDFPVNFRQSYRFRLLFRDGSGVGIARFEAYSESVWRDADIQIEFPVGEPTGSLCPEIHNGFIFGIKDTGGGRLLKIRYADCESQHDPELLAFPPDRTVVTVDNGKNKASFLVTDTLREPIWAPDIGLYVREAGGPELEEWKKSLEGRPLPIYDRIMIEPEQSYERARTEIPQLVKIRHSSFCRGRYVPLGCDSNRQEFALRFNGDVFMDKHEVKAVGRDTAKLLWPGKRIAYRFPTGDPPDFRFREDATKQSALKGYLPIYTSEWKDREFVFTRTDFACYLDQSPWEEEKKRGDEPLVLFSKINIRNTTEERRSTRFWFIIEPAETLEYSDGFIYATGRLRNDEVETSFPALESKLVTELEKRWVVKKYVAPRLRAQLRLRERGTAAAVACSFDPDFVSSHPNAIAYDIELEPRSSHEIEMVIPFITFVGEDGREQIAALDYNRKLDETVEYWEKLIAEGAGIVTPEPIINDFAKATIPHIAITVDKDVGSGQYMVPAGTYGYYVCSNESCHQIRSLDMRGHHERARKYLKPFVDYQGSRRLHGKYRTQEGVFHGLKVSDDLDYQTFNYNLDHGFVLFALCEHYFLTRDRHWANGIAPNLVAACDFVTRERQYTMKTKTNDEKVWEYGLLPPGHLEDNPEWHYWYAVNAYCYRGMAATAVVLEELGHPEASRTKQEAEDYRRDIRRAMGISMERSPVAQLCDGTSVPFQPTRCHLRGRDLGWIRDSLYGPIHAMECGVLDPDEEISTWILKDGEENVFLSRRRGRQVDTENYWFSQGGNTIQSGLLQMAMVYLKRGQPEHAIRSLYNALGQNLYADVRCFAEHPVWAYGLGVGPFYKTPDESCWINWLRHIMLSEKGFDRLDIAPGAPRAWFEPGKSFEIRRAATYFGPMSYTVTSQSDTITATIHPPKRNPPREIILHLRHPEKKDITGVTVDGAEHRDFDPSGTVSLTSFADKTEVIARYM